LKEKTLSFNKNNSTATMLKQKSKKDETFGYYNANLMKDETRPNLSPTV
jgi:hypothetical protein